MQTLMMKWRSILISAKVPPQLLPHWDPLRILQDPSGLPVLSRNAPALGSPGAQVRRVPGVPGGANVATKGGESNGIATWYKVVSP